RLTSPPSPRNSRPSWGILTVFGLADMESTSFLRLIAVPLDDKFRFRLCAFLVWTTCVNSISDKTAKRNHKKCHGWQRCSDHSEKVRQVRRPCRNPTPQPKRRFPASPQPARLMEQRRRAAAEEQRGERLNAARQFRFVRGPRLQIFRHPLRPDPAGGVDPQPEYPVI